MKPGWLCLALPALPLLCVALGGGTARWGQAVVLLMLGGLLLAAPPRTSAGPALNAVLIGFLLLAFAAFLPARWFTLPAWRTALTRDFAISLPGTLSAQPWLTAESLVLFLAGMSWLYVMWTVEWGTDERMQAARVFAAGVIALAASFILAFLLHIAVPGWITERHFGPFPNRNQTADFLAVSSLLILATSHQRWRSGAHAAALWWGGGWVVVAWAVFLSFSRAGVAILFVGTAVYLWTEARRARRRHLADGVTIGAARVRALSLAVALLLALSSAFLLFGGDTMERFVPASGTAPVAAITSEFRLRIQMDAFDLIRASPWCGTGLGNFGGVFALFRARSALPMRAVHPESDWMWMASELGWPSLLLALVGCGLVARRAWPRASKGDRLLRWGAVLALVAFAIHGFVDVSAHRLGTVFSAIFLFGLASGRRSEGAGARSRAWPPLLFRALGMLFVAVGAVWTASACGRLLVPGLQGVGQYEEESRHLAAEGDFRGVERAMTHALAWAPLDWTLYVIRASAEVRTGETEAALADFQRGRWLEPFSGALALAESKTWLAAGQQGLAINALAEACRREPAHTQVYVSDICGIAPDDVHFRDRLAALTQRDPSMELPFLEYVAPPESVQRIQDMLDANPHLEGMSDAQKTGFFRIWAQRGDRKALAAAMEKQPGWRALGWRWWAEACARDGDDAGACAIASRFAPRPSLPREVHSEAPESLAELTREIATSARDPAVALRLYRAQEAAADRQGALVTVRRITALPDCPKYFYYLDAQLSGEEGDWPRAWAAWERYL